MDDQQIVETEMLDEYLEDTIYPLCIKKYQTKLHGDGVCTEDGGPFITSLVMRGICCNELTRGKVCWTMPLNDCYQNINITGALKMHLG